MAENSWYEEITSPSPYVYNANAYSAEREMSASAFARSMASLTSVADQYRPLQNCRETVSDSNSQICRDTACNRSTEDRLAHTTFHSVDTPLSPLLHTQ